MFGGDIDAFGRKLDSWVKSSTCQLLFDQKSSCRYLPSTLVCLGWGWGEKEIPPAVLHGYGEHQPNWRKWRPVYRQFDVRLHDCYSARTCTTTKLSSSTKGIGFVMSISFLFAGRETSKSGFWGLSFLLKDVSKHFWQVLRGDPNSSINFWSLIKP